MRDPADHAKVVGTIGMRDMSLSGSGILLHGPHILDPRTGRPTERPTVAAWAVGPSAAVTDAVSTAFMVLKESEVKAFCAAHAHIGGMLCVAENAVHRLATFDFALRDVT
jgi:thiamine biosynthesis lipoprotein ApbE